MPLIDLVTNRRRRPFPHVGAGRRVYAIGDVHGRLDLLLALLAMIDADDHQRPPAETHIVLLGDLIDRGPDSAAVIDHFLHRPPGNARFHFLMGNHEEAMLAALRPGADARATGWLDYGGAETLASYGVTEDIDGLNPLALSRLLAAHIPAGHRAFIAGFAHKLRFGDYLFAHAGIRPGVALHRQKPHDLHWIRAPFLEDQRDHGVIVVHGHTITAEPELRPNRIGIDTGAYRTGRLTALGLQAGEQWLLAT